MVTKTRQQGIRLRNTQWNDVDPNPSISSVNYSWYDTVTGHSLPGYKNNLRRGLDATTIYSGKKVTVLSQTPGTQEFKGRLKADPTQKRQYGISGDLDQSDFVTLGPSGLYANQAESIASSKFYNECAGAIKAIEGLEAIAEAHKTAASIFSRGKQILSLLSNWRSSLNSALSSVRKGNRATSTRRVMGAVSGAYLEWKYGYDPLVKDIDALLHDLKDDFVEIVPIEAYGKGSGKGQYDLDVQTGIPILSYKLRRKCVETTTIRYSAGIKVTRFGLGGLTERLGLSPSNFVPTLYNLLPWTYMIDYFSNLGDIVSAISFDPGQISWCNKTIRHTMVTTCYGGVDASYDKTQYVADPGYPISVPSTCQVEYKTFFRSADRPPRIPSFRMRAPSFVSESGRTKWLNIAAVLASKQWGDSAIAAYGPQG